MAGVKTMGIYPVNRDVILAVLPGEQRSSEGMIVPQSLFTPFKESLKMVCTRQPTSPPNPV